MSGHESLTVKLPGGGVVTLTMDDVPWFHIPHADRQVLFALIDKMKELRATGLREIPEQQRAALNHYRWDSAINPCEICQESLTIEQKRVAYREMAASSEQNDGETRTEAWQRSFAKLGAAIGANPSPTWPPDLLAVTQERLDRWAMSAAPGDGVTYKVHHHDVRFALTKESGMHTGRSRFHVSCTTCNVLLHEATTGPIQQVERHLREGIGGIA